MQRLHGEGGQILQSGGGIYGFDLQVSREGGHTLLMTEPSPSSSVPTLPPLTAEAPLPQTTPPGASKITDVELDSLYAELGVPRQPLPAALKANTTLTIVPDPAPLPLRTGSKDPNGVTPAAPP